jgi:hypothetical protein
MWRSGHRNNADGEDVISARPFVVLADIFIMLFALFLVMPFFMYFNAQRALDYDALESLKSQIQKPKVSNVDYDKLGRDILKAAANKKSLLRRAKGLSESANTYSSFGDNPILKEKYRVGDLIRFRLEASNGLDPFSGNSVTGFATSKIRELADSVRQLGTGDKYLLTRKYKTIDQFLSDFGLDLADIDKTLDVTRIDKNRLWQDHVVQADRKGVIKRITIEGHGLVQNKDETDKRAKKVAEIFQESDFVDEEVEVTYPIKSDPAKQRPYVDITLVFNQDFASLFKEKLENYGPAKQ